MKRLAAFAAAATLALVPRFAVAEPIHDLRVEVARILVAAADGTSIAEMVLRGRELSVRMLVSGLSEDELAPSRALQAAMAPTIGVLAALQNQSMGCGYPFQRDRCLGSITPHFEALGVPLPTFPPNLAFHDQRIIGPPLSEVRRRAAIALAALAGRR